MHKQCQWTINFKDPGETPNVGVDKEVLENKTEQKEYFIQKRL